MSHPFRECGYALGIVVLLAAIYVGGYAAMVKRTVGIRPIEPPRPMTGMVQPEYPCECLHDFFGPIHAIDRQVRAGYWSDDAAWDVILQRSQL